MSTPDPSGPDRSASGRAWPVITLPVELVRAEERWPFDSSVAAGYGIARLLVWSMPGGHVAAVTDLDDGGASITNSAEHIWAALTAEYGQPLVLLEHYRGIGDGTRDGTGLGAEHVDQVEIGDGAPRWRRIWPTATNHPQRDELRRWLAPLHELGIGATGGAR